MRGQDGGFVTSEGEAEPDAESGEDGGDQATVDFERMLDDEEAVFREFEDGDEDAAGEAVEKDVAKRAATQVSGRFGRGRHGKK